jgi:hypothetical protein
MAYHDRQYCAYLVLGDPASPPLWEWSRWLDFSTAFDPVLKSCRGRALLRVGQFTREEKRKEVKFGRLVWNPLSFQKWAHGSPLPESGWKDWNFFFVEASAPSISAAWREAQPPDFFLVVANEGFVSRPVPLAFNPRVFVAIAADMPEPALAACRAAIKKAEALVSARLSATIRRPWGFPVGSPDGFQNAIQDIAHTGLFKPGQMHARPLNLDTFAEKWEFLR